MFEHIHDGQLTLTTNPIPNIMKPAIATPQICELKGYTPAQLSAFYGVSTKIFRRWLLPFKERIGQKQGHFYNVVQVRIILEKLGTPGKWEEEA